ncbi:MAG: response regulator transcription factor [Caulobacteraceae bacterium]
MNILLIEDDAQTARFVRDGLVVRGHTAEVVDEGRQGLVRACSGEFDVVVADRMLPGFGGLAIVKALRTSGVGIPVIFLTAVGGVTDRIEGLRSGADDYLVKPFDMDELDARIEALGRRPPISNAATLLRNGGLELDRLARRVTFDASVVELTTSEFAMLEMLLLNAGRAVTKAMLLESVFDLDSTAPGSIVEPHMSRLRTKLTRSGASDPIRTLRGVGYTVVAD